MNFPRDRTNLAANAASRFENTPDRFRIQRWTSQSLAPSARDLLPCHRTFLDQGPLKFGDGHQYAELKLTNRVLLGGVDALARADQCDVSHLEFADDRSHNGSQISPQTERGPPSQPGRTFLRNHTKMLLAVDFFTVRTASIRARFVFVVLAPNALSVCDSHPT